MNKKKIFKLPNMMRGCRNKNKKNLFLLNSMNINVLTFIFANTSPVEEIVQ